MRVGGGAHAIDEMVSKQLRHFDNVRKGFGFARRQIRKKTKKTIQEAIQNKKIRAISCYRPPSDGDANRVGEDGGSGDAKGVNCFDSPIATSARSRISSACPSRARSESAPVRDSGAAAAAAVGTWIP